MITQIKALEKKIQRSAMRFFIAFVVCLLLWGFGTTFILMKLSDIFHLYTIVK